MAADETGNVYIADYFDDEVRKVSPRGMISRFAGDGRHCTQQRGCGDGGPATSARLFMPAGVAVDRAGNVYIADSNDHEVRKVYANGIVTRFAGTGQVCSTLRGCGNGGPAFLATLESPFGVAVDASGNVYVTDLERNDVRKIDAGGTITRLAGSGRLCSTPGKCGDGLSGDRREPREPDRGGRRRRDERVPRRSGRPRSAQAPPAALAPHPGRVAGGRIVGGMTGLSSAVASRGVEAVRVPLRSALTPEQAVLWLRGDAGPFALVGDWLGLGAVLGSEPLRVAPADCDPFELLDELPDVDGGDAVVVGGGWVGWLGYGLGARIERLPPPPPAPVPRPSFSLAFYDHVVVFDGEQWWFEALWSADREEALRERLAVWQERLLAEPPPAREVATTAFAVAANGTAGHVAAVADCRRRIAEGEILQANLCLRLQASLDGDPLDVFARALPVAQPRFGALLDGVVSLSPERFLRREGRLVADRADEGNATARRGGGASRAARDSLVGSSKDAAEHVMIVDLMRNDLGRVCEYGSIAVEPARVEAHAGVWQMVSTVSGRLRPDVGDGGLLRATFPPGSVTGAPKVQAMKVIATLEATRRELYTGAIGIVSPVAGLELSVAIRTFETHNGRIWFGAGGGIVADSDPELELAEAFTKAAGPIAAIGGRIADAVDSRRRAVASVRAASELRPPSRSGPRRIRNGAGAAGRAG